MQNISYISAMFPSKESNKNMHCIAGALRQAKNVLLVSHVHPDGDALGSMGGIGHILKSFGCRFALYNHSGLPDSFAWMPLPVCPVTDEENRKAIETGTLFEAQNGAFIYSDLDALPFEPELVITVDCGNEKRAGSAFAERFAKWPSINIDHHRGNPHFGTVANWVEPTAAATAELIVELGKALEIPLGGDFGACTYLGIMTDTASFSLGNTTPHTLRLAAELREAGVNGAMITEQSENQWSQARFELWGHLMLDVQVHCQGTIAVSIITDDLLDQVGAIVDDLEGWAGQLRKLRGARIGVMVRNQGEGSKISLRSSGDDDIRQVAAMFGGGGHLNAAGAELKEQPKDVAKIVVAALQDKLSLPAD
ncbi:MAG: bifunctional oligoribonuclease/PAP phosphatase NrnA [Pseudomonadota bacterium]